MRGRVLRLLGAVLLGWATLLAATYLLERPLLKFTASWLGSGWIPTAQLSLDCVIFAAAGWVAGRLYRPGPLLAVGIFAATLTVSDFGEMLAVNVPWLLRLTADAVRDPVYLESLAATAATHAFLFGSLFAGGLLSRPTRPVTTSIVGTAQV